jgi:hypothetical protein
LQERWRDGDGYLTASEIAALKRDADRVIYPVAERRRKAQMVGPIRHQKVWASLGQGGRRPDRQSATLTQHQASPRKRGKSLRRNPA